MHVLANGNVGIGKTDPFCKLEVIGAVNISAGNRWAVPSSYMQSGSLTIGDIELNYGNGTGTNNNLAGLMLECSDNTEISVHDRDTRITSLMSFQGSGTNAIQIGRDTGWGTISKTLIWGNVGIKKSDPSYSLDVAGDINCSGTIRINGVEIKQGATKQIFEWDGTTNATPGSQNHYIYLKNGTSVIGYSYLDYLSKLEVGSYVLQISDIDNVNNNGFLMFRKLQNSDRCSFFNVYGSHQDIYYGYPLYFPLTKGSVTIHCINGTEYIISRNYRYDGINWHLSSTRIRFEFTKIG